MTTLTEDLNAEVLALAREYAKNGEYVVPIRKGFVDKLVPKVPYLGCLGKNGASLQVKVSLESLGYEVRRYGTGGVLTVFFARKDETKE